ncbi:zeta toxin family protein [Brackiella oedipodis]|uniref:zeta toxin family protein n=1 Tax=Brackiella oedipodis TaxID=124225 RepID=UPI000571960D|nr:zeta toxin family protein [Brackiella oedipodis]
MSKRYKLLIVGGPNGAGKSTLVKKLKLRSRMPLVNPDDIAVQLGCSNIAAGKIALERREHLLKKKTSFAIETTLTGNIEKRLVKQAKSLGYQVDLIYVGINSPAVSNRRVKQRVLCKGHDVPQADVFRRYHRSMFQLEAYIADCDRAFIFDNSGRKHKLIISINRGKIKVRRNQLPIWSVKYVLTAGFL